MPPPAPAEASQSNPGVPSFDELFRPTYRFEEPPSPWPATRQGYDTPIYQLGWLIRIKSVQYMGPGNYRPWCHRVVMPKWDELGLVNDENARDGITAPGAKMYGAHHLFITIAGNHWKTVSSMRQPEVRQRVLRQALEVLGLDPMRATADKLRWLRYPAPKNTLKKPVTYPAIYKDDIHVLPECIMEIITGSWKAKYPVKLPPETLHYIEWTRAYLARKAEDAQQQDDDDDDDASDCSGSTTIGPTSS